MSEEGTTIIKVKSMANGHYECVPGQERLLAHLAMGKAVMAEDVETGDRMKLAVRDGKVMVMPPANAAIAETIAAAAIAKAFRSSSRELQRMKRGTPKKKRA
jgi:hypothetical protein